MLQGHDRALWRNHGPVEPLRGQWLRDISQHQRAANACNHPARIEPVGRVHRVAVLQLLCLPGHRRNRDGNNRAIEIIEELDSRNLIGRRVQGNRQLEHGALLVMPADHGRPIEIAVAALHQSRIGIGPIAIAGEQVQSR